MNVRELHYTAKKMLVASASMMAIVWFSACGGKPAKVTTTQTGSTKGTVQQKANVPGAGVGVITPATAQNVLMPRPEYRYERFGKVDPFEPILKEGGFERKVPLSPLERFDVHELKLKAIIYDPKNPVALLEDPEGETYIVKRGMKVGRMGGVITRISREKVYILEKYEDIFGNTRTNEVVLSIEEE